MGALLMNKIRIEKGLSQAALARETKMDQGNISRIENQWTKPYLSQMQKIASALQYEGNPADLFEIVAD